jgi:hypothetical protein
MNWIPPYLLQIRVRNRRHSFTIWLPLFILGPIFLAFLLALFLIALPFALLSLLFTWRWWWEQTFFLAPPMIIRLLFALRGLKVNVEHQNAHFVVAFY